MANEILIVEDNQDLADIIIDILKDICPDKPVLHLKNGDEANDLIKTRPLSLIILDLNIPKMKGSDIIFAMKKDPSVYQTPLDRVILSSGELGPEPLEALFNNGECHFMPKPYDLDQFEQKVKELLI